MDNNSKGRSLELAVELIERVIFASEPTLRNQPVSIKSRVVEEKDGCRSEIDLLVEVGGAMGYGARYIFECKNWKEPVGKNEVVILADKLGVFDATKAFLVGQRFTSGAIARAKAHSQIELVIAKPLEMDSLEGLHQCHYLFEGPRRVDYVIDIPARASDEGQDLDSSIITLDGRPVQLKDLLGRQIENVANHLLNRVDSASLPDGEYVEVGSGLVRFRNGKLKAGGDTVVAVRFTVTAPFTVVHPATRVGFEVGSRGTAWVMDGAEAYGKRFGTMVLATRTTSQKDSMKDGDRME